MIRRFTRFDPGKEAIQGLARIVAYAMAVNVFFVLLEIFTVFYSQIPEHMRHFEYLIAGLAGHGKLVPWTWIYAILTILPLIFLINPATRRREGILAMSCAAVFVSLWIEKGIFFVPAGFIPSPLGRVFEYSPTVPEIIITLGVWAMGLLILAVLYKIAVSVKEEINGKGS
jgi:molybdopterin-containing oxidoreductase family membrane subunit